MSYLVQEEDGVSRFILEEGDGFLLLEEGTREAVVVGGDEAGAAVQGGSVAGALVTGDDRAAATVEPT